MVAVETGRTALRPAWIEPAVSAPSATASSVGTSVSRPVCPVKRIAPEAGRDDGPQQVQDVVDERDLVPDEVGRRQHGEDDESGVRGELVER